MNTSAFSSANSACVSGVLILASWCRVTPASRAARATGDDDMSPRRPAGLSGCEITATTLKRDRSASKASKAGTAKAAVPKKAMRSILFLVRLRVLSSLLFRDAVHVQFAVEVIQFVLQNACKKIVRGEGDR